jgi:hypothetical protein
MAETRIAFDDAHACDRRWADERQLARSSRVADPPENATGRGGCTGAFTELIRQASLRELSVSIHRPRC